MINKSDSVITYPAAETSGLSKKKKKTSLYSLDSVSFGFIYEVSGLFNSGGLEANSSVIISLHEKLVTNRSYWWKSH